MDLVYFEVFGRIDVNLGFAGFRTTSDLHCVGLICVVLASPLTTGSMCCIFGVLWALLSFSWSFIDPGTLVKGQIDVDSTDLGACKGVSGHF